ncbi:MAG TPA: hypothetical protein VMB81_13220 [Candidatus Sulfotelmatobacter sp.]|nr:hypothetical protein [Candidatus Sulfotelmatobacter sp.]
MLTLYTTPVVYLYLSELHRWFRPRRAAGAQRPATPVPTARAVAGVPAGQTDAVRDAAHLRGAGQRAA